MNLGNSPKENSFFLQRFAVKLTVHIVLERLPYLKSTQQGESSFFPARWSRTSVLPLLHSLHFMLLTSVRFSAGPGL